MLSRLLALTLALLLPLQLAWGMAAGYCQHEQGGRGSSHFGHHAHVHTEAGADAPQAAQPGKLPAQPDMDCTACHASAAAMPAMLQPPPPLRLAAGPPAAAGDAACTSAPQRAPDRPQWPRLA